MSMLERLSAGIAGVEARWFGGAASPATAVSFAAFMLLHLVVWTLYPWISQNNLTGAIDMAENLVWGQEFQFGYYKHPPLFAWFAGVWFAVLPRAEWAYYLLSATNAVIGLAGTWCLIGLFDRSPRRLAAVLALLLTPLYTFLSIRFNANTILLAVWPWLGWSLVRSVRSNGIVDAMLLGLFAALAMLGKYYSVTFLIACAVAVLALPGGWRFFVSRSLLISAAVGLAVLTPHLIWLVRHDFIPFQYARDNEFVSLAEDLKYLVRFPGAQAVYLLPMLLAIAASLFGGRWRLAGFLRANPEIPGRAGLIALGTVAFLATFVLAIGSEIQLSSPWGIPLWFLAGYLLLSAPGIRPEDINLARIKLLVLAFYAVMLLLAPAVNVVSMRQNTPVAIEPRQAVAEAVTRLWRETTRRPLAIVAGSGVYSASTVFYSPDRPSEFIGLDPIRAPWITPERIARDGLAIVCASNDGECLTTARSRFTPAPDELSFSAHNRGFGLNGPDFQFILFVVRPTAGP